MPHRWKRDFFHRFAQKVSGWTGTGQAFMLALAVVLVWLITGPLFDFSDTWQLVINTGTTVVTFIMVFLIQNTQNRDTRAIQLKLDELIRATEGAHLALLDLEELRDEELETIYRKYLQLAERARIRLRNREPDTDNPEIVLDIAS